MHRSRIQLPLTNPPIASYQADATILSVALQCDQSWNWFYNNFVQLCVFDQHGTQELKFRLLNRFPHEGSECPFVRVQYILRDYVAKAWSTISEFTKDAIKSLDHVFVCLDRYYLPYSPDYRSRHRPHQTLISAIDTDSKTAILSDFAGRRGYGRYSVRWSDLDQSFPRGSIDTSREADPWNILLVVLLRYQSVLYEFDFNRLMLLIDDYLGGRNYSDSLDKQSFLRARNAIYGVEIYRFLLDYATQVEFGMQGDRRIFQTLYDHKRAMSMRARFLYYREIRIGACRVQPIRTSSASRACSTKYLSDRYNVAPPFSIVSIAFGTRSRIFATMR